MDATADRPRFLRIGAIPEEEILGVLQDAGHFEDEQTEDDTNAGDEDREVGPHSA